MSSLMDGYHIIASPTKPLNLKRKHNDADSGASIHPKKQKVGQPHGKQQEFPSLLKTDSDDSKDQDQRLRENLVQLLEKRFRNRNCISFGEKQSDQNPKRTEEDDYQQKLSSLTSVQNSAAAVERMLFVAARNKPLDSDYDNPDTLPGRLERLWAVILHHRLRKKELEMSRSVLLKRLLGSSMYIKARRLVHEINQLRQEGPYHHENAAAAAAPQIPEPVKNLFFGTRILYVFENMNLNQTKHQDWEMLVSQAARHIRDYRVWLLEQQPQPQEGEKQEEQPQLQEGE